MTANGLSEQAEQGARRHLQLATRLLKYSDFWEYGDDKRLSIEQFSDLVALAAFELFRGDPPLDVVAEELGATEKGVMAGRKHPQYRPIKDSLEARFRDIADSRSMKHWAEILESELSLEMAEIALSPSIKGRAKTDAASSFLDRQSAKAGRGDEMTHILMIPDNLDKVMQQAMEISKQYGAEMGQRVLPEHIEDAEFVEIDAGTLNVPKDED